MKDFQSISERELGMKLLSTQPIPQALQANSIGDYEYLNTQLSQGTLMSNVDADCEQGIPGNIYKWSPITCSISKYSPKDYSQNCTDTNNFNYYKFGSQESGINWDYMSKILSKTSGAAEGSTYPLAPIPSGHTTMDDPRWSGMLQRTTSVNKGQESGSSWSPSPSSYRSEEALISHPVHHNPMDNGVFLYDKVCHGLHLQSSLPATSLTPEIKQLYDQRFVCPTQKEGVREDASTFLQDVKKNKDQMLLSTSKKQFDFVRKENGVKCLDRDHLILDDSSTKTKFRLLVDQETESWLRAELHHQFLNLSDIITLKYRSLGIVVEVEPYQRPYPDKINTKAFSVIFENSSDVAKAFSLVDNGQLPFSLREARPSPSYHVKYEVLQPVGVFKGKCFRQKQIHQLQTGDIVTANQLKGNKVRIIKWCPVGSKIHFDLPGWVLLKTQDRVLLGRANRHREKRIVGKTGNRSTRVTPVLQRQRYKEDTKQIFESNPLGSSGNCWPFKVLVEVEVLKGRKKSTIIGRLKPGRIVWASQQKGQMLRLTRMDTYGNIVVGVNLKPKTWGWVCLQQRVDEQPRLIRIPTSLLMKTRSGKVTEVSYPSMGRKNSKIPQKNFKYRSESPHYDLASIMPNDKDNTIGISSSSNIFSNMNFSGSESFMSESSLSTRPERLYSEPVLLF